MDDDRILSTHTGSLPRPDDLIQIMWAVSDGILRRGGAADLPIPGSRRLPPERRARRRQPGSTQTFGAGVHRPITVRDMEAAHADMKHLTEAGGRLGADARFSSAASPGVVSLFFRKDYYPSHEEYVFAIAEAMRHEYEAIAAAGATVQLDCPDRAPTPVTPTSGPVLAELSVPDDKVICPGVIEPQSNYIEHPELVAQQLERWAPSSTRAGSWPASTAGSRSTSASRASIPAWPERNLAAMAQGCEIASRRLFG